MSGRVFVVLGGIGVVALALWMLFRSPGAEHDMDAASPTTSGDRVASPGARGEAGPMLKGQADGAPTAGARTIPQPGAVGPARARAPAPAVAPRAGTGTGTGTAKAEVLTEIRVRLGDGAPARGSVRIRPTAGGSPAEEHLIGPDGTLRVPTQGDVYLVVAVEGREARGMALRGNREDAPVEVVFGTGAVFGTVRDARGLPSSGVVVRLSTHLESTDDGVRPIAEGHVFTMSEQTDVDGSYRFEDLPVGDFVLVARRARDDPLADRNIRSVRVSLGAGESARVDFGEEDLEPLLTGVLRYGDGVAVERSVHMFMTTVEGGGRLYVNTDAEGRYSQRMPAGTYEVEMVVDVADSVFAGMRLVPSSQRIVLEARDTVHDITFPGTRVEGRLRGHTPKYRQEVRADLVEPEGEVPVSRISKQPVTTQRVIVREDGTYRLDGLSPGLWRLTGSPRLLRPFEIRVDAKRDVIAADLELEKE